MRRIVLIAISAGFIVLATLLVTTLFVSTRRRTMTEQFQTQKATTVTAPFLDKAIYGSSGAGIQACDVLRKPFDPVSDNFVDTFRLRKWVPQRHQSGAAASTNNNTLYSQGIKDNKQFCYFFTNSNDIVDERTGERMAPVLDPISSVAACDKASSLFAGAPFIDKAFLDTSLDATHTLPYSKCVLQIDPAKINSASLSNFWAQMNDSSSSSAFCKGYLASVSKEIEAVAAAISAVHNALLPYRVKYDSLEALRKRIATLTSQTLTLTGTENPRLADQLSALQKGISQSNVFYGGSNALLESKVVNLGGVLTTRISERDEQAMRRGLLIQDWNVLKARSAELARTEAMCANALREVVQSTKVVDDRNEVLRKQYAGVEKQFYTCRRELQELDERFTDVLARNDELVATFKTISRTSRECSTALQQLQKDEVAVNTSLADATTRLEACQVDVGRTLASVRGLEQANAALYEEIADIKKRCRNQQMIVDNKMLDAKQSASQMLIRTQQQVCASAINLRNRKTELLAEISSINSAALQSASAAESCDRMMDACGCHALVAHMDWNDKGREGNRALTTSGRIDEVRSKIRFIKGSGNEPVLRWKQSNGQLTAFHAHIGDKRDAGSREADKKDNWVEVRGDLSSYGNLDHLYLYYRLKNWK